MGNGIDSSKIRLSAKLQIGCFVVTTMIMIASYFWFGPEFSLKKNAAVCALMMAAAVAIGAVVIKVTCQQIERVIASLNEASTEVMQASGSLTASSHKLAEGSSEQSAAVQETSATMEETSSLIHQTSQNTKEAVALAENAKGEANLGVESVTKLLESMGKLEKSSEEVQKIIKVIDDMAFQTNILSLNAAVEAARAGDAGKGFAVVAEEVRNLAQRSAQAAQETAALIDGNVGLTKTSVRVSEEVGSELKRIDTAVSKVKELLDEVATASQEQVIAVSQISQALTQIDQVVQTQSAVAQTSADGASNLEQYCSRLENIKIQLINIIRDASKGSSSSAYAYSAPMPAPKKITAGPSERRTYTKQAPKEENLSGAVAVNPEDVIPLDDF